jgi:hypothetical protein
MFLGVTDFNYHVAKSDAKEKIHCLLCKKTAMTNDMTLSIIY